MGLGTISCPRRIGTYLGDYSAASKASGSGKLTIVLDDAMKAVNAVTSNLTDMPRLTWDSFIRAMGQFGYPANEIIAVRNMAWPFLPEKVRTALQRREQPSAPPPPVSPPVSAPSYPSPIVPGRGADASWYAPLLKYGGPAVAAIVAGLIIKRFVLAGRR